MIFCFFRNICLEIELEIGFLNFLYLSRRIEQIKVINTLSFLESIGNYFNIILSIFFLFVKVTLMQI